MKPHECGASQQPGGVSVLQHTHILLHEGHLSACIRKKKMKKQTKNRKPWSDIM